MDCLRKQMKDSIALYFPPSIVPSQEVPGLHVDITTTYPNVSHPRSITVLSRGKLSSQDLTAEEHHRPGTRTRFDTVGNSITCCRPDRAHQLKVRSPWRCTGGLSQADVANMVIGQEQKPSFKNKNKNKKSDCP